MKRFFETMKSNFIGIAIAVTLLFLLLNLVMGQLIHHLILEKNDEYIAVVMNNIEDELNATNQRIIELSSKLQFEERLQSYFIDPLNIEILENIEEEIISIKHFYKDIYDVALVDDQYINSNYLTRQKAEKILKEVGEVKSPQVVGVYDDNLLLFICAANDQRLGINYGDTIGYIIISVRLDHMMKNIGASDGIVRYIIKDHRDNYFELNGRIDAQEVEHIDFDRRKHINKMNLEVLVELDKAIGQKDLRFVNTIISLMTSIFFLIISFGFVSIYNKMVKPINDISNYLKNIVAGNYKLLKEKVEVKGHQEIEALADDLNNTITEVNHLTAQLYKTTNHLYEMELYKNQAEISYLRSQINPHFLYNTLETVKGMAHTTGNHDIVKIAQALGMIFRYSIQGEQEVVLEKEMQMIEAYCAIQKLKFLDKVDVIILFNEEQHRFLVPKMILQPVVENAFKYGVESQEQTTILYIGVKINDYPKQLVLAVQDDGVGMDSEKLEEVRQSLNDSAIHNGEHIGLINVHQRIRKLYGEPYGLTIQSQENEGTKVEIVLPLINSRQEDKNAESNDRG